MHQFDICRLKGGGGRARFVVILQADLLDEIETRVCAPLSPASEFAGPIKLRPEFEIDGKAYRLVVDRLSVLRRNDIGAVIGSARDRQWDIRRALDLVFVGV